VRAWVRSAVLIGAVTLLAITAAEVAARAGRSAVLRREGLLPAPLRADLSGLSEARWLDYDRLAVAELRPYVGFAPRANYRSATVNTNALGFRGPAVRNPKPPGRVPVAVIGGSAAFGTGASSDAVTFPARLEAALRTRTGRDVEVVNGGAPPYVSGQELGRLTFEVLDLEPDIAVVYDGFNDLNSALLFDPRPGYPSNFSWLERAVHFNSFRHLLAYRIQLGAQESGLGFWARRLSGVRDGVPLAGPAADPEIIETYRRNLDRMVALLQSRGIRVICVSQPTLVAKRRRTRAEDGVLAYMERRHPGYARRFADLLPGAVGAMRGVASARGVTFADLSNVFDDSADTIFFDTAHVTDRGNALADRLAPETEKLL
jgi:GDSL-like Lipase/Acylhydrolase family